MFSVSNDKEELNEAQSKIFHTVVAKLLHVCKRTRPDIEPVIAFLSTRVSCSTNEDLGKLERLITYIKRTINDRRTIGARDLKTMLTWVDAAYAVHPNMRGQTGGAMSFGTGIVHGRSSKQKLNAKSSTEAEIIGVSEYMPFHIWANNFLKSQGYKIENNILFQDNKSAILLERNGRNSCTGNSRHIDIRYFFIKDRIESGDVEVVYCPTDEMLADFFTKPLQGKLFRKFRDMIMGFVNIPSQFFEISKMKEHVENRKNQIGKSKVIYENYRESKNVKKPIHLNPDEKSRSENGQEFIKNAYVSKSNPTEGYGNVDEVKSKKFEKNEIENEMSRTCTGRMYKINKMDGSTEINGKSGSRFSAIKVIKKSNDDATKNMTSGINDTKKPYKNDNVSRMSNVKWADVVKVN